MPDLELSAAFLNRPMYFTKTDRRSGYKTRWGGGVKPTPRMGPELVRNGDFSTSSDWIMTGDSTITGGKLVFNNKAIGLNVLQTGNGFVIGKKYRCVYTISDVTQGSFRLQLESAVGQIVTLPGRYTDDLVVTNANARIFLRSMSTLTCKIDDISVRELL